MIANVDVSQRVFAQQIINNNQLNVGAMRPFIGKNGGAYVQIYMGGDPVDEKSYKVIPINTNATLRRDEWKQLDEALLMASRTRLGGVDDLISNGLVYNLGNAMGTTVLEWHDVNDAMEATVTMDGVTRGVNDRPKFQTNYLPIPIIHVDYEINARELEASRKLGNPLDTVEAEFAARRILEKLESMLFTDTTYSFGEKDARNTNTIYSYVNHPDRNTVSIGTHWNDLDFDSSTANGGETIVNQVINAKQTSINDRHYGPWMLYIPTAYETVLDKDYDKTTPGKTIRERITQIAGIKGIKTVDTLVADNVLLVQMTTDVVRLIRGLPLQNVQWGVEGNMITKYKVLTIQVPQIRSDQNKRSGIVHLA